VLPAIEVEGLSVRLGDRLALAGVNLAIPRGAFVGLLGPNGSGKSTLLRSILGIVPAQLGRIRIDGREIGARRDRISYLPQRQHVDFDVPLRVSDVVMMGRLRHTGWFGAPSHEDRDVVAWALETVGISDRRGTPIGELSFGQQQRVFFARALAQQGDIVLLDEPMNGVDTQTQDMFVGLLEAFHAEGKTIVMATHDLNMAACICDNLCLLAGRLVAYGPVAETFRAEVLQQAYGTHLHFVDMPAPAVHPQVLEDVHHHDGGLAGAG
jgi:ABC-type Mn2+/Zn2+ transport system ATPase subunit